MADIVEKLKAMVGNTKRAKCTKSGKESTWTFCMNSKFTITEFYWQCDNCQERQYVRR